MLNYFIFIGLSLRWNHKFTSKSSSILYIKCTSEKMIKPLRVAILVDSVKNKMKEN